MAGDIDFVMPWVNGSDKAWQEEFGKWLKLYTPAIADSSVQSGGDASEERYRDWDMLRYWFRGVERFAPWVRTVHFLTWGHLPAWMNTSHPKLNIVNHKDFIPQEYLPTFSSCPIELNIHRIEGLSGKFVYFNDDMVFCRPVNEDRFFKVDMPKDIARLSVIRDERVSHNIIECMRVINRRHTKREAIMRNPGKWFNTHYSAGDMLKTATLLPWSFFPGFKDTHAPQPFLKNTLEKLWSEEFHELDSTCRNRFRTLTDLSQWVVRYEQLASGQFAPARMKDMGLTKLADDNNKEIADMLLSGKYSVICINDSNDIKDAAAVKKSLIEVLEKLLPEKSQYEL